MAGERVGGPEGDPEAGFVLVAIGGDRLGYGRGEAHPVAFEVAVVDPDRIEALVACLARPAHDLVDVAAGGEAETDRAGEGAHGESPLDHMNLRATAP